MIATVILGLVALNTFLALQNSALRKHLVRMTPMTAERRAPDFELTSLSDDEYTLSSFAGRDGKFIFFEPGCGACESQSSGWNSLAEEYEGAGKFFVGICSASRDKAREFADRHGLQFPILLDEDGEVAKEYKVISWPFSYEIDAEGRVTYNIPDLRESCIQMGYTPLLAGEGR